jgi:hypothetical protein
MRVFYTKFEDSVCVSPRASSPARSENVVRLHSADVGAVNYVYFAASSQRNKHRTVNSGAVAKCYECGGRGHFANECPTRAVATLGTEESPPLRSPIKQQPGTTRQGYICGKGNPPFA